MPRRGVTTCYKNKCCTPAICEGGKNCDDMNDGCGTVLHCGGCTGQAANLRWHRDRQRLRRVRPKTACPERLGMRHLTGRMWPAGHCLRNCDATTEVCQANHTCCKKTTCEAEGKSCGTISDGCGGMLTCGNLGMCPDPAHQVCLGNGTCCNPITCDKHCGYAGPDGCGAFVSCPACPAM